MNQAFVFALLLLITRFAMAAPPVAPCATEVGTIAPATKHRSALTFIQATIAQNAQLKSTECMVSPNRAFVAVMQSDGQLVVYDVNKPGTHEWAAGTQGNEGASLLITKSGNIQVYAKGGIAEKKVGATTDYEGIHNKWLWSSNSGIKPFLAYYLAMQDDGNLVVYRGSPKTFVDIWMWSHKTGPSGKPISDRKCTELCTYDPAPGIGRQCQYPCR
jgi:hypothetical protein